MNIKKVINLIKFKENCKQKDIAKALNVSENYLSDIVSGRSELTESFISKLELTFPYISEENIDKNEENQRINQRFIWICEEMVSMRIYSSLASLAVKYGKSKTYFSDLKSGKARYSESFLRALSRDYFVNMDYVHTGEGEMFISNAKESVKNEFANKEAKDTNFNRLLSMYEEMQKKFFEQSDQIIKTNERLLNMLEDKGKRVAFSEQIEQSVLR